MARLVLSMAAASFVGAGAFLLPSVEPAANPALRTSTKRLASAPEGSSSGYEGMTRASMVLGGLLAAAACRNRRLPRKVVAEDIEKLTITDLPEFWRPKVSIGMARRAEQTKGIKRQLEKTFFMMAVNRDHMLGRDIEEARALFPESVKVRVLKNNLVRKAMEGSEWEAFGPYLKGSNMYVFVESDRDLKPAIQAYVKMEKQFGRTEKLDGIKELMGPDLTYNLQPLVGGIMSEEWDVLDGPGVLKLKDFPTKTELIGQVAGAIKQVTTKLAVGIKQVPTKLAIGIKNTIDKGEEEGKSTMGEVS